MNILDIYNHLRYRELELQNVKDKNNKIFEDNRVKLNDWVTDNRRLTNIQKIQVEDLYNQEDILRIKIKEIKKILSILNKDLEN